MLKIINKHHIGRNDHKPMMTLLFVIMSIVLDVCRARGLFFNDSKTNYHSVVGKLAVAKGMASLPTIYTWMMFIPYNT